MKNIIYSQGLADLANIVIINSKVVKNRHGNIKDGLDGLLKIKKIDNIIIQFKKNIFICCKDEEKICEYKKIIKKLKDVFGEEIINSRIKFI
ncbi:hypothetical protein K144316041_p21120 (plasmid) [Clostridium tetani]|uniref:hypothetical protein n=1 Tax=Clostridium tetani TaxID=1513 RepID=UPI00295569DA|nr:hypothetical protein [Clostridium tetani]BDR74273.1 hypothetical protein K144316041_p21120 [Clostridium tetani]